jgi:transcriptional regulator with XRE-family HTH domain
VPAVASPTVRRRELAALLQQYREATGMTITEVSERLLCHPSKISRIESGQRAASVRDIRDLGQIYGIVDAAALARLATLAREARQHGWWQDYDLPTPAYVGMETDAARLSNFESSIVPGLLQTPDYARTVVRATRPELTAHQVEQTVEARIIRQNHARENSVDLWFILDEAALHRVCGSPPVMRAQIDQLIASVDLAHVVVQVIPFTAGAHLGMNSSFVMIDFERPNVSSIVFVEGLVGYIYLEKDKDLARYRKAFDHLRAIAASPADSLGILAAARRRHSS